MNIYWEDTVETWSWPWRFYLRRSYLPESRTLPRASSQTTAPGSHCFTIVLSCLLLLLGWLHWKYLLARRPRKMFSAVCGGKHNWSDLRHWKVFSVHTPRRAEDVCAPRASNSDCLLVLLCGSTSCWADPASHGWTEWVQYHAPHCISEPYVCTATSDVFLKGSRQSLSLKLEPTNLARLSGSKLQG